MQVFENQEMGNAKQLSDTLIRDKTLLILELNS